MKHHYSKALRELKENADTLREYMDYGGDLEHAFWLHIDLEVITKVNARLNDMIAAMESESART